jgi:hypothetical protein
MEHVLWYILYILYSQFDTLCSHVITDLDRRITAKSYPAVSHQYGLRMRPDINTVWPEILRYDRLN